MRNDTRWVLGVGLLLSVAVMLGGAAVIGSGGSPAPSDGPAPVAWTEWKLATHTDGDEMRFYGLRPVSGVLHYGDKIQVCVSDSVFLCSPSPPRFIKDQTWSITQVSVDRTVVTGDTWAMYPLPVPPQTMVWVRAKVRGGAPSMVFRVMWGGAYGWSEPDDTWEVSW